MKFQVSGIQNSIDFCLKVKLLRWSDGGPKDFFYQKKPFSNPKRMEGVKDYLKFCQHVGVKKYQSWSRISNLLMFLILIC